MTVTLSPYAVAHWSPGQFDPHHVSICGHVVSESDCLRLVDEEKSEYRIGIVDDSVANAETIRSWPLKESTVCLLNVDIGWVLSTVRISRIHSIEFRFQTTNRDVYLQLWPPEDC